MASILNTNLGSLAVRGAMSRSQGELSTALQRLSSGLRINGAKDDAAGLSISERMTSKVRGLAQAGRNVNDGISMLQVAESALGSVTSNLQRVRELTVQAANATLSASDRAAVQQEVGQLMAEIDRIAATTQFNGLNVFNASTASVVGDADQLAVLDGLQTGWLENAEKMVQAAYGLTGSGAALSIELTSFTDGAGGTAARVAFNLDGNGYGVNLKLQVDMADFTPPNLPNGGTAPFYNDRIIAHEMVHAVMASTMAVGGLPTWFLEGTAEFVHGADERVAVDLPAAGSAQALVDVVANGGAWAGTSAAYSSAYVATRFLHDRIKAAGGSGIRDLTTYLSTNANSTLDQALASVAGLGYANTADFLTDYDTNGAAYLAAMDLANADTGAAGGADADGGAVKTATSVVADSGTTSGTNVLAGFAETFETVAAGTGARTELAMQAGADANQTLDVSVGAANTGALGLAGADVTTGASGLLGKIDRAIAYVSGERTRLGAQMNRLASSVENLAVTRDNLAGSRSRIVDADFAAETSALTRSQVLQQAAAAMLAQANLAGREVLSLLR